MHRFILPSSCLYLALLVSAGAAADTEATEAQVSELKAGISFSIPPWVVQETQSGFELDVLRESLKGFGYRIKPIFLPVNRAFHQFDSGQLDLVINARPGSASTGHYSDPAVTFQNVAISLSSKSYPEDFSLERLQTGQVIAFQKASQFLGPEFREVVSRNPHYQEVADQQLQLNLLFYRGVDFIIMEEQIFRYYYREALQEAAIRNLPQDAVLNQAFTIHRIFPSIHYPFVFQSEKVRDAFNSGLQQLKMSGRYESLKQQYFGKPTD